jgi:hypothetical protein
MIVDEAYVGPRSQAARMTARIRNRKFTNRSANVRSNTGVAGQGRVMRGMGIRESKFRFSKAFFGFAARDTLVD